MLQKLDPVSSENDTRDNDINDNINVVEGVSQALKVSLTMNLDEENVLTGLIAPSNPAESDLNREENRLATFEREASPWPPNAKMEARKIAKAGLYYTGQYQEAKCPWCNRVITQWDYGEQAIVKHRELSPDCPFVLGTSNNVPLLRMTPSPTPSPALSRSTSTPRDIPDGPAPSNPQHPQQPPPVPPPQEQQPPNQVNVESQEYLSEANRFRTFGDSWPLSFIRPADLANAGFIYTGQEDIVQCVFCREFIGRWDEEDFPHTEHRSIYPNCPFVLGRDCGNIPIQSQPYDPFSSSDALMHSGQDEAGHQGSDDMGEDIPNGWKESQTSSQSKDPSKGVLKLIKTDNDPGGPMNTGIISHTGPSAPKYCTVESRLRTFHDWPSELRQRPADMADAGFYHILPRGGASSSSDATDKVKCYYCDGGLMNWAPEDDPWIEHARWFDQCSFVRLKKGDDFIREVLLKYPRQPVPELPGVESMPEPVEMSIKEDQLRNMMSSMLVNQVLEMGLAYDSIQAALEKKLRSSGTGYKSARELADAAMKEGTASSEGPQEQISRQLSSTTQAAPNDEKPSTSGSRSVAASYDPLLKNSPKQEPMPKPPQDEETKSKEKSESEKMDIELPKNSSKDLKSPEEELQQLKDQRLCKVCFVEERNVAFLPCGHLICCVNCVPSLKDCPYCRQPITGTLKTFMS